MVPKAAEASSELPLGSKPPQGEAALGWASAWDALKADQVWADAVQLEYSEESGARVL